ncbi:MAG TPA: hypothetical protein VFD56_06310, partial [Chitinophagaceae bacterium]|nr:hypothetical protein [Chitinophagaceae bacterium]
MNVENFNAGADEISTKSPLLDPAEHYLENLFPLPWAMPAGGVAAPVIITKRIADPQIIIKLEKFVWQSKDIIIRQENLQKYLAMVGCLSKDINYYYDVIGHVLIRSKTTREEIPYNQENNKLNFPGKTFFPEVEIIPGRDTNLTFSNRVAGKIVTNGKFESKQNNIQLQDYKQTIIFRAALSDPTHVSTSPADSTSGLYLETVSTDIPSLCEYAKASDERALYYSNWYRAEAQKRNPLKIQSQLAAIKFNKSELGDINYYLSAVGMWLSGTGFLNLVPNWQAPDYWTWACRHSIWNEKQSFTYMTPDFISERLLTYRNNYTVGRDKPLPFHVFIGELRRFEDIHSGDISIDELILRLRRSGHESSLIF